MKHAGRDLSLSDMPDSIIICNFDGTEYYCFLVPQYSHNSTFDDSFQALN